MVEGKWLINSYIFFIWFLNSGAKLHLIFEITHYKSYKPITFQCYIHNKLYTTCKKARKITIPSRLRRHTQTLVREIGISKILTTMLGTIACHVVGESRGKGGGLLGFIRMISDVLLVVCQTETIDITGEGTETTLKSH